MDRTTDFDAHKHMRWSRHDRLTRNDEFVPHMRLQLDGYKQIKRARILRRMIVTLTAGFLLAAFLALSSMSYHDMLAEHAQYCTMVKQHLWPDYRHIFKSECR
jgi:hypothetical protein